MSSEDSPACPSSEDLLRCAVATAAVRLLPGRYPPRYPVPLRCGIPTTAGQLIGGETAWLIGPRQEVSPAQTEVLSRWPDGSARWVLVDVMMFVTNTATDWIVVFLSAESELAIRPRSSIASEAHEDAPSQRSETEFGLELFSFPVITDSAGESLRRLSGSFDWHATGPIRSHSVSSNQLQHLTLKIRKSIWNTENTSTSLFMAFDVTIQNTRRASHRGGLWDLGDSGSVCFQKMIWDLCFSPFGPLRLEYQLEPNGDWIDSTPAFSIHQESSGGEQWDSINHRDRNGSVPWRYRGFTAQTTGGNVSGLRATPSLRVFSSKGSLTLSMLHFWQKCPMSLEATAENNAVDRLILGFFPHRDGQLYELQGGEQSTHTFWLKIDRPGTPRDQADLSWVHDPPRLVPVLGDQPLVPGWPRLTRLHATPLARLNALCDEALHGPASIFVRREEIDEYGWRNFGEFFADHESVYYKGDEPLISHFNNQYDVLGGLLLQALRTENLQWFELADDLMRHVTDIDLYHTDQDRAVYNGGLFWMTDHYTSCGTATHRTFSKRYAAPGKSYGGGPGAEHNYTTGLLVHYWLTGEPAARSAVTQLADWVIAMDDGRKTIFGLLDHGPTGSATATAQPNYHGPGRGAGSSINALLDAWLSTGQRPYLQHAERIIRRCIHPADDITARNLLNFELRWSYTIFLMSLYKYLECKRELSEFDVDFEYARQSLLHYAHWMAEHERPYFDRAEQMEFPTETWGAQELRKANALRWAAVYADEDESRDRLKQRGDELAERAWHDLCRFPTRTFIRPFTLAMIQGLWDAALREENSVCTTHGSAPATWGEPVAFRSQKARVNQMLKSPRGLCTALVRAVSPWRWGAFFDAMKRQV